MPRHTLKASVSGGAGVDAQLALAQLQRRVSTDFHAIGVCYGPSVRVTERKEPLGKAQERRAALMNEIPTPGATPRDESADDGRSTSIDVHLWATERLLYGDHTVEIVTRAGVAQLWIDGVRERFHVSPRGYTLHSDSYSPPRSTLLDAAAMYLSTQPKRLYAEGRWRNPQIPYDPSSIDLPVASDRQTCERKNFVNLGGEGRARLALALNTLYHQGVIEDFADEHDHNWYNVHWGPAFLPWHRHFLLRFESELRSVDSGVSIPYWDWTQPESREIFSLPEWLEFFGDRDNHGGRFDDWNYTRGPLPQGLDPPRLPTLTEVVGELARDNYQRYRAVECYFHHTGPHRWVGGSMNTHRSPRDPLFYLHHCNVDRLWAVWQRNHPDQQQYSLDPNPWPADPSGCDYYPNAFVSIDHPMAGGATPRSMLDHLALRYFYRRDIPLEAEAPELVTGDTGAKPLTPRRIAFGGVYIDQVKTRILGVGNSGPDDLDVIVDGQWSSHFLGSDREGRVPPCGRLEIPIIFVPSGRENYSTQVAIRAAPAGSPESVVTHVVDVTGSGRVYNGPIP
jgi:hypothetical protein